MTLASALMNCSKSICFSKFLEINSSFFFFGQEGDEGSDHRSSRLCGFICMQRMGVGVLGGNGKMMKMIKMK